MKVFFTSDWHLGHSNIMKYCKRPFISTNEMNDIIIANYNNVVGDNDIVYNLGDIAFKTSYGYLKDFLSKLNGSKVIIVGNHDNVQHIKRLKLDGLILNYHDTLGITVDKHYIWLSHYAHRTWNRSFHGSWHLFGHSHSKLEPYGKSFDVGVDAWEFKPVSFNEVCVKMASLGVTNI